MSEDEKKTLEKQFEPHLALIRGKIGEIALALKVFDIAKAGSHMAAIRAALREVDIGIDRALMEARRAAEGIIATSRHRSERIDEEIERRKKRVLAEILKPQADAVVADIDRVLANNE